jgi:hypothetical protein
MSAEKKADRNLEGAIELQKPESHNILEPPYSIFPKWQRIIFVYVASLAAFISPVSSSIFLPALSYIAADLNTTISKVNLTITTYMVS